MQHLVSQKKKRLIKDGFDLDLSYVTDNIIAMGLPCTGRSALYRNPQGEVVKFLNHYHGGEYKIYNLCTRPKDQYDPEKFEGRVACFPFEDHGVPKLETVDALAQSVVEWLSVSRSRVVCIHCLAGKGRTGLMVCAALLKLGIMADGRAAMAFYGERRMRNKKGVTQASQRRWVEYYEQRLRNPWIDYAQARTLVQVSVRAAPPKERKKDEGAKADESAPSGAAVGSAANASGRPTPAGAPPLASARSKKTFETAAFRLRVSDGDGRRLADTGAFHAAADLHCTVRGELCVELLDDQEKLLAQMFLHAAFLERRAIACGIDWWDVERHHKTAKKTMKHIIIDLLFDDDGTFDQATSSTLEGDVGGVSATPPAVTENGGGGYVGGRTLPPCTDKQARRAIPLHQASASGCDGGCDADEDEIEDGEEGEEESTEDEIERVESMRGDDDGDALGTVDDSARLEQLNELLSKRRTGLMPRLGETLSRRLFGSADSSARASGCGGTSADSGRPDSGRADSGRLDSVCTDGMPPSPLSSRASKLGPLGSVDDEQRLADLNEILNQGRSGRMGGLLGNFRLLRRDKDNAAHSSSPKQRVVRVEQPQIDQVGSRASIDGATHE